MPISYKVPRHGVLIRRVTVLSTIGNNKHKCNQLRRTPVKTQPASKRTQPASKRKLHQHHHRVNTTYSEPCRVNPTLNLGGYFSLSSVFWVKSINSDCMILTWSMNSKTRWTRSGFFPLQRKNQPRRTNSMKCCWHGVFDYLKSILQEGGDCPFVSKFELRSALNGQNERVSARHKCNNNMKRFHSQNISSISSDTFAGNWRVECCDNIKL